MSYEKYCDVIDQLCEKLGIEDPQTQYELCNMQIDGTGFSLTYTDQEPNDLVAICNFGEVPENQSAAILRRVLEMNMFLSNSKAPRLAINPDTGHVLMIAKIPLEDLSLKFLIEQLGSYADLAEEWRTTHYLDNTGQGSVIPPAIPLRAAAAN